AAAPEPRPVLAHVPTIVRGAAMDLRLAKLPLRYPLGTVLRREEDRQRLAEDLRLLIAQDALGPHIPTGDVARRIDQEDRVIPDRLHPGVEQLGDVVHSWAPGRDSSSPWWRGLMTVGLRIVGAKRQPQRIG